MQEKQNVQLLLNGEQEGHASVIIPLLSKATRLECTVAFAKESALGFILEPLKKRLAAGLSARFSIGLSFCQTSPTLLRKLLALSKKHQRLSLYVSNTSDTFHPKIYGFSGPDGATVIIGSANLTSGGLSDNYEASAVIDDPDGTLIGSVARHVDGLIDNEILVSATKAGIDEYAQRYAIYQAQQRLATRRAELAIASTSRDTQLLRDILTLMQQDQSESGFASQVSARTDNRKAAAQKIRELASVGHLSRSSFIDHYEELISLFHSGGLHRGKNIIADNAPRFIEGLRAILQGEHLTAQDAYQILLGHFDHVPRAGVNVITEILLALDSKRFAVMNQNAVSGLSLANIRQFPAKPNKTTVRALRYADFCDQADRIRRELGLRDFVELDALFNYAYWGTEQADEDEEDDDE